MILFRRISSLRFFTYSERKSSYDIFAKLKDSQGGKLEDTETTLKRKPTDRVIKMVDERRHREVVEVI